VELVNATPVPAKVEATELHPDQPRIGAVTAKATFRLDPEQGPILDGEDPVPVFAEDEQTDLGILPRDNYLRVSDHFEVIVLGVAHAPRGRPTRRMKVRLSVGDETRVLRVTGDRRWERRRLGRPHISEPESFERMPLTWERAQGGAADVLIDLDSPVEVSDPRNPAGRGLDVARRARELAKVVRTPHGYPVFEAERPLPNVEDPRSPVEQWADEPEPAGWSTLPLSSPVHPLRAYENGVALAPPDAGLFPPPELLLRAHPDWVIGRPEAGATVRWSGLTANGDVSFALPKLRVLADYVVGEVRGTTELRPVMLVLLPEEQRFYLVYRDAFEFRFEPSEERSLRLRTTPGWFQPEEGP